MHGCAVYTPFSGKLVVSDLPDFAAETYIDLAVAYIDMGHRLDALQTVNEGLSRYPQNVRLLALFATLHEADE